MALFVDQNKRRKSPLVMLCFCVSLLFMCIYGAAYGFLTEPLYLALGGSAAATFASAVVMSFAGTCVCCLLFFLKDKRLVPGAYLCLAVLLAVFYLTAFFVHAESRMTMLRLITLFGLGPVAIGNAVAWPIYLKIRGAHSAPVRIKTLREELREIAAKNPPKAPAAVPSAATPASNAAAIPTEEEALFGPEVGENPAAFHSAQEEAMLFYDDEESDN